MTTPSLADAQATPVPAGEAIPREVADALHALHEGRLDEAGLADLEARVLGDPAVMRAYLDLTLVHGTLSYAAGTLSSSALPALTLAEEPPAPAKSARWRTPLTLAACLALLCGLTFLLRPAADGPPAGVAVIDPQPEPDEPTLSPAPGEPAPGEALARVELPVRPTPELFPDLNAPPTPAPAAGAPNDSATPAVASAERNELPSPAEAAAAIDAVLAHGWSEAEVAPSPEADPGEWLRRAWLDLAGHAPPPEQVDRFLADERGRRRERELNRLLSGDSFAQHLAERWTTALVGRAPRPGVDRAGLRAHLADQFERNVGWDLVAAELIAAAGDVEQAPAANFLVAHVNNQAVPATAVVSRALLGTRVQCMQCHDHPHNGGEEWSQERFWELNAFFKGTDVVQRPTADGARVAALEARPASGPTFFEDRRGVMMATFPRYAGETVEAADNRREKLAELLLSDDRRLPAKSFVNRAWAHLFGAGLVNPVDDLGPHNPPSHPAVLDALTDRFIATGYDVKDLYATLAGTRLYGLSGAATEGNAFDDPAAGAPLLFTRCYPKPLTVEQTFDSLAAVSGQRIDPRARDAWVAGFVRPQANDENGEDLAPVTDIPRALALMNGEALDAALDAAAENRTPADLDDVFLAALSRRPTARERRRLAPLVRVEGGLEDLRWALLNSGEFATVP
ncbi:DUF1549 domain-containing protein [Alienimonas californiensis]|uniref:DUF1549 domain-containing protein n=1 Tax=Alienimonas californiensis TaxID=2527989 RepID=A0A517PA34_9PLAN|nr:DUF1549 domain-containing protein [Alienimonas californiensis]QDT16230.1 hypothetical protein CA12_23300 [Alienimonas californiensis]